jgi:hypothetical protein
MHEALLDWRGPQIFRAHEALLGYVRAPDWLLCCKQPQPHELSFPWYLEEEASPILGFIHTLLIRTVSKI